MRSRRCWRDQKPDDDSWRQTLRAHVDELDSLERDFSPDYDRSERFDELPSRDRLIAAARERYPEVFAGEPAATRSAR